MRFIQQDIVPSGVTDALSLNRYSFVKGNPIQFVDPDGNFFGIDDLFAAIAGAIVNVVSQLVECGITSGGSFSGEACGWEDFVGAAVGGAAGGVAALYCGPPCAGAVGGAFDSLVTNGLKAIPGGQETSWAEFGIDFGIQVGTGFLGGKLFGGSAKTAGKWSQGAGGFLKNFGKDLATGVGKGAASGALSKDFWLPETPLSGIPSMLDRSTRPPGDVWNQYSNPRSDAWDESAGRSCIEHAWR
jgi:hypothetical protein